MSRPLLAPDSERSYFFPEYNFPFQRRRNGYQYEEEARPQTQCGVHETNDAQLSPGGDRRSETDPAN